LMLHRGTNNEIMMLRGLLCCAVMCSVSGMDSSEFVETLKGLAGPNWSDGAHENWKKQVGISEKNEALKYRQQVMQVIANTKEAALQTAKVWDAAQEGLVHKLKDWVSQIDLQDDLVYEKIVKSLNTNEAGLFISLTGPLGAANAAEHYGFWMNADGEAAQFNPGEQRLAFVDQNMPAARLRKAAANYFYVPARGLVRTRILKTWLQLVLAKYDNPIHPADPDYDETEVVFDHGALESALENGFWSRYLDLEEEEAVLQKCIDQTGKSCFENYAMYREVILNNAPPEVNYFYHTCRSVIPKTPYMFFSTFQEQEGFGCGNV